MFKLTGFSALLPILVFRAVYAFDFSGFEADFVDSVSDVNERTPKEVLAIYKAAAKRMTADQKKAFLIRDCLGKTFTLSQLIPDSAERSRIMAGKEEDLSFTGDPSRAVCNQVLAENPLLIDPNVLAMNDVVEKFLGAKAKGTPCDLKILYEKQLAKIEEEKAEKKKNRRSKIDLFTMPESMKMEIQLISGAEGGSFGENGKAVLSYEHKGKKVEMPVDMEGRGAYRRALCRTFPPIKLILPKEGKSKLFDHADRDMKLVTHCHLAANEVENKKVLREYAVYRILEASGLMHFKAQLVEMTYKNAEGTVVTQGPAIFIENRKDAYSRFTDKEGKVLEPYSYSIESLSLAEGIAMNSDWSIGHNTRAIDPENKIYLPYDFDLTQWVRTGRASLPLLSYKSGHGGFGYKFKSYITREKGQQVLKTVTAHRQDILDSVANGPLGEEDKRNFTEDLTKLLDELAAAVLPPVAEPFSN